MKIVYLSSSTIPSRAANSIHVMKMCQAFARNGHEVVLVAPDKKDSLEPGVDDVYEFYGVDKCFEIIKLPWLPVKGRGYVYGFWAALKTRSLNHDVVFCRNNPGSIFATMFKLPVIFETHAPFEAKGRIFEKILYNLFSSQHLRKIIVITHALRQNFETKFPATRDKLFVAPDGADPVPERLEPIALPNKGERMQVGYLGHLYKGRGIDVIIALARECPWADFHLVGGIERDISAWKAEVGGQENIVFHGFIPPADAERMRISFDVLLAPYQREVSVAGGGNTVQWMSPLKAFEYMAAGRPILCSDLPVLKEVFEHDRNALLCPPDDVAAWILALTRLKDEEHTRQRLGQTAHQDFIEKYTWAARAERVLAGVGN